MDKATLAKFEARGYHVEDVSGVVADGLDTTRYLVLHIKKDSIAGQFTVPRDLSPESMDEAIDWIEHRFVQAVLHSLDA